MVCVCVYVCVYIYIYPHGTVGFVVQNEPRCITVGLVVSNVQSSGAV